MVLYGAIEAGGTKFVCAVASGPDDILSEVTIATRGPGETLKEVIGYFKDYQEKNKKQINAVGIGCFGPLDLRKGSETYGYITSTPKEGWQNTEIAGYIERELKVPAGFDTDVNAAAYGEYLWGAGTGLDVVIYLTVGTGIGGGLYVHGRPVHGLMHPEMGHVIVRQDKNKDPFEGCCPYHDSCLEGLASGRAVDLRWGCHAAELGEDHPGWELESDYLAQGLMNFILTVSPERIILGGGLMHKKQLFPMIRKKLQEKLNGYILIPAIQEEIDNYIVSPALGEKSGISGAIGLAAGALEG